MALTTASSDNLGSQANTQSPQTSAAAGAGSPAAAPSGSVQPGTARSLLTNQNGVALGSSGLTTVQLGGNAGAQTEARAEQPAKPAHQINPVALAVPAGLLLLAIILFWIINRSAKNTTK